MRLRACGGVTPWWCQWRAEHLRGAATRRKHFEASPVEDVVHTQVHVADERVSAHSPPLRPKTPAFAQAAR